jgi:hypothetical protein
VHSMVLGLGLMKAEKIYYSKSADAEVFPCCTVKRPQCVHMS